MKLSFGKYKGMTVREVLEEDPAYIGKILKGFELISLTQEEQKRAEEAYEEQNRTAEDSSELDKNLVF